MKKSLLLLTVLLWNSLLFAQTTTIPDNNFEEALIYQGIDTDGIVNGQVATADIENITTLNISDDYIGDLTGIEDFTNLENLDISWNGMAQIDISNNVNLKILNCEDNDFTSLDLSQNILLEELYCSNTQEDAPSMFLTNIDLSNNPMIHIIDARSLYSLETINLKNGNNNEISDMDLDFHYYVNQTTINVCVQVDDEEAANADQSVYATWNVNGANCTYSYSENCALGSKQFSKNTVRLYPNPAREEVHLKGIPSAIQQVEIFNLQGKRVKLISDDFETINLNGLTSGMYFVKLSGKNGLNAKKLLIKN